MEGMNEGMNEGNEDEGTNGGEDEGSANDDMVLPPPMLDISQASHECPYCHTNFTPLDMILHLRENHPLTLSLWIASSIASDDIATTLAMLLSGSFNESLGEDLDLLPEVESYEYWLNLEEMIGNHDVGVDNVDDVAPFSVPGAVSSACTICLEEFAASAKIRKISVCGHEYCASCLETWLSTKKFCPLCRADTTIVRTNV